MLTSLAIMLNMTHEKAAFTKIHLFYNFTGLFYQQWY